MICYSFLEKRGDYIKRYITWKLKCNEEIIINNDNVECEFTNNVIKYQENDNIINIIDLDKEIYLRESDEFIFKVDFKCMNFDYILKEYDYKIENEKIKGEFIFKNNIIKLIYQLEDEKKKIIIHLL